MSYAEPSKRPWTWDGYELWHFGEAYESEADQHEYTGITSDKRLDGSERFTANRVLVLQAVNAYDAHFSGLLEISAGLAHLRDQITLGNTWDAMSIVDRLQAQVDAAINHDRTPPAPTTEAGT